MGSGSVVEPRWPAGEGARGRVIEIREPGGPEVLGLAERETRAPGAGEVQLRVAYSGVNRADLLQRRGRYPAPAGVPEEIPGLEFAGEVVALGPGCSLRRVGDRVMGILGGGGYSEFLTLDEALTIPIPSSLSLEAAGAVPEAYLTAWDALVHRAAVRPGDRVLIHAVGSGVGLAALQLTRALGAIPVGTARSGWKLEAAHAHGLEEGVEIGGGDPWTGALPGGAVQVILDLVGAPYIPGNLEALDVGGRWVAIGVPGGGRGEIDLRKLMGKRGSLIGTVLRARSIEEKVGLAREIESRVLPWFQTGALRPVIDRVYPVEAAAEAHWRVEENQNFGKVLLRW